MSYEDEQDELFDARTYETRPCRDPHESTEELLLRWHFGIEEIRDQYGRL